MVEHCEGPLKMRARQAGRIITATVCNSSDNSFGNNVETANVNRQLDTNQ